jgi:hypothetical protein
LASIDLIDIDLPSELAAARKRLAERTATALRDSRVNAIRSAVRPGSPRLEVEEVAHRFYPRLRPELVEEAINIVCGGPAPVVAVDGEAAVDTAEVVAVAEVDVVDDLDVLVDLDAIAEPAAEE